MYLLPLAVAAGAVALAAGGCASDYGPAADPSWSSDGKRIAFTANLNGSLDVYVSPRRGGTPKRLTTSRANDAMPAWSPDGRRIAFVSDRGGDVEIYVMNTNGSHQRRLTRSRGMDTSPAWSPDGMRIAFATAREAADGESSRIYVMAADGT